MPRKRYCLLALFLSACAGEGAVDEVVAEPKTDVLGVTEVADLPRFETGDHILPSPVGDIALTVRRSGGADVPLILYCGGTAFTVPQYGRAITDKLSPFGDLVLWDYPGRGKSGGSIGLADARAMTATLNDNLDRLRAPGQPVVYWGHSLGGFVCADMVANDPSAAGLVLESTATGADAVADVLGNQGVGALLRLQLPPEIADFSIPARIDGTKAKVLVIGGARDRVLPVSLQRDLADAIPGSQYIEYAGANHFDAGFQPDFEADIRAYLEDIE
jgi:pimeloyl-ACP methyl ester carboxylesterase